MTTPLYELKAEFFRTLAHPARVRILEVLAGGERSVGELAGEVGLSPAHLSGQLAVLRRAGLVGTRKQGTTVFYSLSWADLADLLSLARTILTERLSGQVELLRDLETPLGLPAAGPAPAGPAPGEPAPAGRARAR